MTNDKFYLVDTNVWISNLEELKTFDNLVVTGAVLRELDKLKSSQNQQLAFDSRKATRFIKENKDKFKFDLMDYDAELILGKNYDNGYADNRIVAQAFVNEYGVISNDINVQFKALGLNLEVRELGGLNEIKEDEYQGFKVVEMTKDEYQDFHDTRLDKNEFELLINEYLIVLDKDTEEDIYGWKKPIQSFKWDGEYYIHIKSKVLKSRHLGDFKPYDEFQACAIDSVVSNQFTILRGSAGTAKTQIAISYAMQQLQSGKHDKIIVFSNAVPTASAHYHGLVKGDLSTKLLDSSIGNILASKLGSYDQVQAMMLTEELMVLPASDIRGFDSNGMNACIVITEGQNWTAELLKLAIQRTGSDCSLIIEGDRFTQLDGLQYSGMNNGMYRASEVFKGQPYFGEVELQNIYRSEISARAELMTDSIFFN